MRPPDRLAACGVACGVLLLSTLAGGAVSFADHPAAGDGAPPGRNAYLAPEIQRGLAEAREREQRRRDERATPAARERRAESRTAHRGLGRDAAIELARRAHPEVLAAPHWRPLELRAGERVEEYLGDYGALVESGGRALVVQSSLPMRAESEDGELAPVDLALEDQGATFAARNPLIETTIPKLAAGGVVFDRAAFQFALSGASPTSAGTLVEGRAFYPDAARDTDMAVQALPHGIESFLFVRSADSPESATYQVTGAGVSLRAASGDATAIEVVRDGAAIAFVERPAAWDADGEPVPVSWEVRDGNRLELRFPHHDGDFAYPIAVDPVVTDRYMENFNLDESGNQAHNSYGKFWNDPFVGWGFSENRAGFFPHYVSTDDANRGLTVYGYQGVFYNDNDYGEWYWQAPRQAFIERADFGYVTTTDRYRTCTIEGIWSPSRFDWDSGVWYQGDGATGPSPTLRSGAACSNLTNNYKAHCVGTDCAPNGTRQNMMIFGMLKFGSETLGTYPIHRMIGASIWLYDYDTPQLTAQSMSASTADWTSSGSVTGTFTAVEPEPGLGIWKWRLRRNGVEAKEVINACGDRSAYCPTSSTVTLGESGSSIPEGVQSYTAVAYDATRKAVISNPVQLRIDRSAPTFTLVNGALRSAEGGYVPGTSTVHAEVSDPYSGIKSLELKVDGQTVARVDNDCSAASGCPTTISHDFTLNPLDYDYGTHTLSLVATDPLGHTSPPHTWQVKADPYEPIADIDGTLWAADDAVVRDRTYDLTVSATDGEAGDPESGVRSIEVLANGQRIVYVSQSPSENADLTRSWTWSPGDGDYGIEIRVTDGAQNTAVHNAFLSVRSSEVESADNEDMATTSSYRLDGPYQSRTASSTAHLGDIDGDGVDDYAVGGPNASYNGRSQSGSVWIIHGAATTSEARTLYRIDGANAGDRLGTSVAPAGDVNGDGITDLVVGAPASATTVGKAYVIFGSTAFANLNLSSLGARGFQITGPALGTTLPGTSQGLIDFATTVAGARRGDWSTTGDMNGDGLDDVVVGAGGATNNSRLRSGAAYVIFGKTDSATVDVTSLGTRGMRIDGASAEHRLGTAVAMPGDLDGDGLADLVLGSPGANQLGRTTGGGAYVVLGNASTADIDLANPPANRTWTIHGAEGDRIGNSVAGLGDVNGDDLNEIALGGTRTAVVLSQLELANVDLAVTYPGYSFAAPTAAGGTTSVVAPAGDLNSDLQPDLLIGYPLAEPAGRTDQGALYAVYSGQAIGQTVPLDALKGKDGTTILGAAANDQLGSSAQALDAAGNSEPGVLVGAPGRSTNSGSVYVVRSSSMSGGNSADAASSECYRNRDTAYGFAGPRNHRVCRATGAGATERAPGANPRNRYGNGRLDLSRRIPRNPSRQDGRWAIKDSFNEPIAWVEPIRRHAYRIYREDNTTLWGTTPNRSTTVLQIQGVGCMATDSMMRSNMLVSIRIGGTNIIDGPNGRVDGGVRGFIARSALPSSAVNRAQNWTTGCGTRRGSPVAVTPAKPDFIRDDHRYQGSIHGDGRCDRYSRGVRDADCGGKYHDYNRPAFNDDVIYLMAASTGVRGGGIVRAIIRRSRAFMKRDQINYVDSNVPCTRERIAQWVFGDANPGANRDNGQNPILGWYPVKTPTNAFRSAGC